MLRVSGILGDEMGAFRTGFLLLVMGWVLFGCGGGTKTPSDVAADLRATDGTEAVPQADAKQDGLSDSGPGDAEVPKDLVETKDIHEVQAPQDLMECGDGFLLDPDSSTCKPLVPTCAAGQPGSIAAQCVEENRACVDEGTSAICGECLENYVSTGDACVPETCAKGVPGSIAEECAGAFRLCLEGQAGTPATCGGCVVWYVEEQGNCRPVELCETLGCTGDHKKCTVAELHQDAECGSCIDGFVPMGGVCQPIPMATCDEGTETSITSLCAEAHRVCLQASEAASCGDCIGTYFDFGSNGECELVVPCAELDCEAQNRTCLEVPAPHCGECIQGFAPDLATFECVGVVTCATLGCESLGMSCSPEWGQESAYCFPACPAGKALSGSQCVPCSNSCDAPGEAGALWPVTSLSGKCVCQTLDGWFYTEGIDIGTYPCDVDADGWVAESARLSMNSSDPAVRVNARCKVRAMDRVVLQNELGETLTILLPELVPNVQADHLELYEPDHLDNEALQKYLDLPAYGARQLHAAELNPLVKYCADADYNGNGGKDFQEWQDIQAKVPSNPAMEPFVAFSSFGELNRGWYQAPEPGASHGTWWIQERPRIADDAAVTVPIGYDGTYEANNGALSELTADSQMKSCVVWPDPAYNPLSLSPPMNQDFAQFAPSSPSMDFARTVELESGQMVPIPENHWDGMNLGSQFRCVQVVNSPPDVPAKEPNRLTVEQFSDDFGLRYQLNICTAMDGEPGTLPPMSGVVNPYSPAFACTPTEAGSVAGGQVGWAAVRYRSGAPYEGGCINQCVSSQASCGLCGFGVWLDQSGVACGEANMEPGYAGIPSECDDIQHPVGVDLSGVVCDGCEWQGDCDDGSNCTINLCHQELNCVPPIPTPDNHPCPDDGNACTFDFCTGGVCKHNPKPYGTSCPNDDDECKTWVCGGSSYPTFTIPGTCVWLLKLNAPCVTTMQCVEPKCNNSGTCGQAKVTGSACTLPEDGNPCTVPKCLQNAACGQTFAGESAACTLDSNECTLDHCALLNGTPTCTHEAAAMNGLACGLTTLPATCNQSTCQSGQCKAKGVCTPLATQTCNICGSQTCSNQCLWGTCTGWDSAKDDYEGAGNQTKQTAKDLGTFDDDPNPATQTYWATLVTAPPDLDVDWYKISINDTCCEQYPGVTISIVPTVMVPTPKFSIYAEWICKNNSAKKLTQAAQVVPLGGYTFSFTGLDCDGSEDSVDLYMRVQYDASSTVYTCSQYAIVVDFQ